MLTKKQLQLYNFIKDYNKERFAVGNIVFCKDGSAECYLCGGTLTKNRTPAQMKAIIDNLL